MALIAAIVVACCARSVPLTSAAVLPNAHDAQGFSYDRTFVGTAHSTTLSSGALGGYDRSAQLLRLGNGSAVPSRAAEEAPSATDTVVLGHYPEYVQTAERVGGRTFNVPKDVWDSMSPQEQWAANRAVP